MRQILFTIAKVQYCTSSDNVLAIIEHKSEDHDLAFDVVLDFDCDHLSISSKTPDESISINQYQIALVLAAFVKNFFDYYNSLDHDASPLDAFELFTEFAVEL